ncbi:MAG: GGDEF domain-containing protein [Actinomycetota bacterium]
MKGIHREPYALWLVAGLPLVGAFFLAPEVIQDLMSPALALAASLAILLTSLRCDGALRLAWMFIGAGFLQSAIGDGLWTLYEVVWEIEPFPSYADLFYLAFYPLIAVGLVTLVRWHKAGDRDNLVDAAIVAIGAGVLTWVFIMSPYVFDSSMTLVERLASLAYPVGDLLLLAVLVRLVFSPGKSSMSSIMLTLGIFSTLVADAGFAVTALQGTYETGHLLDAGWLLTYVLVGAAVLHPSTSKRSVHPYSDVSTLPRPRLVLLAAASMISPGVLIVKGLRDNQVDDLVVGGCSATLFLLVLFRMAGLVRQVQAQATKLETLSDTDELTGAPNRRVWFRQIPYEIARAQRSGRPLSAAIIDIDHFKAYNDTFGHQEGDRLLHDAVKAWQAQLRGGDVLVRFGGDEFVALLPDCDLEDAERAMERIRTAMPFNQTCSTGVACFTGDESADDLLARADKALYASKDACGMPGETPAGAKITASVRPSPAL